MTAPATVPDILARAADIIDQRGWHQGDHYGPGGTCCAIGAMWTAAGLDLYEVEDLWGLPEKTLGELVERAIEQLRESLALPTLPDVPSVADWNDEPGRTKDEVVAALRAAAQQVTP